MVKEWDGSEEGAKDVFGSTHNHLSHKDLDQQRTAGGETCGNDTKITQVDAK